MPLIDFLSAKTPAEKYSANPRFIAVSQRILKREWEVLKADVSRASGIAPSQKEAPSRISSN
jgi:hypothetical protein